MDYRKIDDKKISLLGFGGMRFPVKEDGTIDQPKVNEMVDYALSHGVNYFDTAYGYHDGKSEGAFGEALGRHPRDSYYLADKFPIWACDTPDDLERIFQLQLDRGKTDHFDFYLMHNMNKEHYEKALKVGLPAFMQKKKDEGKVTYIGFSFHDQVSQLREVVEAGKWDFVQIQMNYLDWDLQDAKTEYQIIKDHNMKCVVMEPVRGGYLANLPDSISDILKGASPASSIASWAIRYTAQKENVLTVLSGMSSMEQMVDNVNSCSPFQAFSKAEQEALEKAIVDLKMLDGINCTGCRYCMDCPFGVDIPRTFGIYNLYMKTKNADNIKESYFKIMPEENRANHCVACGACMEKCPQQIKIPDRLAEVHEFLNQL